MELVAWLAGERHTDEPRSACPVIGALVRAANDLCHDPALRDRLLRGLAPRLVGSRADGEVEMQRAWIAADAVARFIAPLQLDRLGESDRAAELRTLRRIQDRATAAVAAAAVARVGLCLRAASWTLRQAGEGRPAPLWITGVAHAAWRANELPVVRRIVDDMLGLRLATR
ncbi:MAG: hypothetical protein U1F36_00380 [Planctomycetota bacterium]